MHNKIVLQFLIVTCVIMIFKCSEKSPTSILPPSQISTIDTAQAQAGLYKAAKMLQNGNKDSLKTLFTQDALISLGTELDSLSSEELKLIGKALADASRVSLTSQVAEYLVTLDGFQYSIIFTRSQDTLPWKIFQF